jgi:hypothetical protein
MAIEVYDLMSDLYQSEKLREIANAINKGGGYSLYESFVDTTSQTGSPIDTPKQVKYGNAKTSPTGILSMDSAGTITVLKGGPLLLKSRLRASRTGAAGTSSLFFWVETSVDNGVTWNILGNSIDIRLENSSQEDVFFDFSSLTLPTGIKLRSMFARSSTGSNYGDLTPSSPSAALQAYGLPIAPSAQLSVYKLNGYVYEA